MPKVTAREYQKKPGYYQDVALTEPVEITKHGRRHTVLVSDQEYRRLKRQDRQALYAWEVPAEVLEEIKMAEVPPGHEHLDAELED